MTTSENFAFNATYPPVEYSSNKPFEHKVCISKENACVQVAVAGPPKDSFVVKWDGQLVDLGQELKAR